MIDGSKINLVSNERSPRNIKKIKKKIARSKKTPESICYDKM